MEIFDILGAAFPPSAPIDVTFCTAKRTQVPVGPAEFDLNRCNESPLRGEKPDFWPVSKNNTGSLPLRGILPVKNTPFPIVATFAFSKVMNTKLRFQVGPGAPNFSDTSGPMWS